MFEEWLFAIGVGVGVVLFAIGAAWMSTVGTGDFEIRQPALPDFSELRTQIAASDAAIRETARVLARDRKWSGEKKQPEPELVRLIDIE